MASAYSPTIDEAYAGLDSRMIAIVDELVQAHLQHIEQHYQNDFSERMEGMKSQIAEMQDRECRMKAEYFELAAKFKATSQR